MRWLTNACVPGLTPRIATPVASPFEQTIPSTPPPQAAFGIPQPQGQQHLRDSLHSVAPTMRSSRHTASPCLIILRTVTTPQTHYLVSRFPRMTAIVSSRQNKPALWQTFSSWGICRPPLLEKKIGRQWCSRLLNQEDPIPLEPRDLPSALLHLVAGTTYLSVDGIRYLPNTQYPGLLHLEIVAE